MIGAARLLYAAIASVLFVLSPGAVPGAMAQPERAAFEGVFSIGIPSADDAPRSDDAKAHVTAPGPAEIQAVWDLSAAGNWDSASRLMDALAKTHAAWKPPSELTLHVAAGARDQRIRIALERADWSEALGLIPAARAGKCETPFHIWSRAEALEGVGNTEEVRAFYVRILSNCTDPSLIAAVSDRAAQVLDTDGLATLLSVKTLQQSSDPKVMVSYARIQRTENWRRFEAATGKGDLAAAKSLAETSDDPRLLAQAGWTFLELEPPLAAGYFERALLQGGDDEARRGLVMAMLASRNVSAARRAIGSAPVPAAMAGLGARIDLEDASVHREQGDWQSAITLAANAASADPELEGAAQIISGGALLDAAGAAYDRGDFEDARRLATQAAGHPPARRAGLMRAAWSDFQLGRAADAGAAFSRLYLEVPDAESAQGYALAAEKTGDLDTAAALARTLGGPLGAVVEARYAAAAFNDGDYLTARAFAPDTYSALEGLDRTWYRQSVSARSQGGASGENRLRGLVMTTSAGTARGSDRFEGGLSVYRLDPGTGGAATRETILAPYVAWSREGATSLAARIGLLPLGADAAPALTGEIAVAREAHGRLIEARGFSRPKSDSVLSFAGQTDASGDAFGRVTENGLLIRGRLPAGELNAVQAEVSAVRLEGENTTENSMLSVGAAASRSIPHAGFAYLVTGPFYQFQSYDKNTNFFSPGHGGYFSPQSFHRAGWSANAQTEALKNWIVKADLAVAYESVKEDPAIANPLLPGPQPFIGGGESAGVASALDLAIARRVTSEVIVSASLSAIASQAYEDFRIGIALTWVPGGRAGLVRTDLPSDPFNPGSWIRP